uniref:Uncharacterized protein n=1 Tax=Onchocerca volvulus TaxID=6282 RepID=A0A8R1XM90_ONCVO
MKLSLSYPILALLFIVTQTETFVLQELPLDGEYSMKRYIRNFDPVNDIQNYMPNDQAFYDHEY